ncbi:MAG: trans-aconitate 2-methyltransferase [Acidobacteriota bacterium]|nr:trans-aconitate 2-methyltransferase [Acidobacteriota bacterium]
MSWNPDQYERFRAERAQPFHDLTSLVEKRPAMRVVDLGCGTGELTRQLHEKLGAAETLGIDSSESMLAKAPAADGLRFERANIETFTCDVLFDLIFSNAALHWVPNHETLFARLATLLNEGGQLAVQMPANDDHASHRIAGEVAERSFGIAPRVHDVLPVARYAELLHELGFARQHVRLQIYGHLLDETHGVVEWVKGTLLTDYQRRLGDRYAEFVQEYTARLLEVLGDRRPYFYTYKRVLLWASR